MHYGFEHPDAIVAGSAALVGSTTGIWGWASLSALGLVVSAVILAFLYIWSILFRNSQLEAYMRQEVYELVVSALLIVLLFGMVGAISTLKLGDFVPDDLLPADVNSNTNVYEATAKYFERVGTDMEGWLNLNYVMNMYVDQMASITPYARPLGVGLVASPLAGFASPIKQLLYNMTVALSIAYIINYAQLFAYVFALDAFLKYYLPMGIFFRSFTPTRRLGGTLIGISAAFLFIFPALTTITYSMFYHRPSANDPGGPLLTFWSLLEYYIRDQPDFQTAFSNFFTNNFTGGPGGIGLTDIVSGAFGAIGSLFQGAIGTVFLLLLIFPISIVSWAFTLGFVVPAFNLIIFTQAAKGLSKSFGEEVDISSLTRMI